MNLFAVLHRVGDWLWFQILHHKSLKKFFNVFLEEIMVKVLVNLNKIILLAHSSGGLLVVAFAEAWEMDFPLQIHSIAAPLAGMGIFTSICNYEVPNNLRENIELHQWRTIKELDGAFSDLDYDPQVVKILKSKVTRLPETYKGNKLGHNWSISWVADELSKEE